jgi:hypothetical protein
VFGGLTQAGGAKSAANAQLAAAQLATNTQRGMFDTAAGYLNPYIKGGQNIFGQLQTRLPSLTAPFAATQAQLASTPGYQFTLGQGLKATQNAYAAQGLGSSGSAMKGAAQYATGLANTTYNQQLQNYLQQNAQAYNMLLGGSQLGESAASALGGLATTTGGNIAQTQIGAGNAQAAGDIGVANAYSGMIAPISQYAMLNQLMSGYGSKGNSGSGGWGSWNPFS